MINLIKNELFKIFKKKGIYIILTLLFAFLLLINYITKESSKDYHNGYIKLLKEEIKDYNVDNLNDEEGELTWYIDALTQIEMYDLASNYDKKSWQYSVINNDGYNYISAINNNIYRYKDKKEEEISRRKYESFKELLKGDWQAYANKELESLKNEGAKEEIKKAELRLKYNIAYGENKLNNALTNYAYANEEILNKKNLTFDEEQKLQNIKRNYYINKYMVENHFDEPDDATTRGALISLPENTELFIVIAVALIASSINLLLICAITKLEYAIL